MQIYIRRTIFASVNKLGFIFLNERILFSSLIRGFGSRGCKKFVDRNLIRLAAITQRCTFSVSIRGNSANSSVIIEHRMHTTSTDRTISFRRLNGVIVDGKPFTVTLNPCVDFAKQMKPSLYP